MDELALRLDKIEAFLDNNARGWRERDSHIERFTRPPPQKEEMVIDEDQTRRDRECLGLDTLVDNPSEGRRRAPGTAIGTGVEVKVPGGTLASTASQETAQAMQTAQDPNRQARASEQLEQKLQTDQMGAAQDGAAAQERAAGEIAARGKDTERSELLAMLEPYKGRDGYPVVVGDESIDQLHTFLDQAHAREGGAG